MGLSLHYNGKFDPAASLTEMIDEVEDVAKIYNWKYHIFETEFPANSIGSIEHNQSVYGICYIPPQCEPIYLCFLSNGRMSSPDSLQFWDKYLGGPEENYLYLLSTKTQYAGYHIHMIIVRLFQYLGKKYFIELNVIDEGKYWETGDETILKETFKKYNEMLDNFSTLLENLPLSSNETAEDYINRLLLYISNKRGQ